jgi:hypothetical protein
MDEGLHVVNSTDMMMISKLNVLFMMLIDMLTWYIDRPTTICSLPSDTSHVGSRPVGWINIVVFLNSFFLIIRNLTRN